MERRVGRGKYFALGSHGRNDRGGALTGLRPKGPAPGRAAHPRPTGAGGQPNTPGRGLLSAGPAVAAWRRFLDSSLDSGRWFGLPCGTCLLPRRLRALSPPGCFLAPQLPPWSCFESGPLLFICLELPLNTRPSAGS